MSDSIGKTIKIPSFVNCWILPNGLQKGMALVAAIDGVGGYMGGDIAARIAKEYIEQYMAEPKGDIESMLREAVVHANNQIVEASKQDLKLSQMCCVLTAAVAGFLFLPFLFLSPLLSVVPSIATAPALVVVGAFMMKPVTKIDWSHMDEAIPCLLALVLIPFSYSITQGIIFGFLSWTILKTATGQSRKVSLTLWIIDIFALASLIWGH